MRLAKTKYQNGRESCAPISIFFLFFFYHTQRSVIGIMDKLQGIWETEKNINKELYY